MTLLTPELMNLRWRFIFSVLQHEVVLRAEGGTETNVTALLEDYGFALTDEATLELHSKLKAFFVPWLDNGTIISWPGTCRLADDGVYAYMLERKTVDAVIAIQANHEIRAIELAY